MKKHSAIFLCAGLTGGPLTPLLSIATSLHNVQPYIIGVSQGFEATVAQKTNTQLLQLPTTKLNLLSFASNTAIEILLGLVDAIISVFKLFISVIVALYYILKYQPVMALSAGGFSTVPIFFASTILNRFKCANVYLVYHQQDPKMSLTGRLCLPMSHYSTSVFEHADYSFDDIIPNPIDYTKFDTKYNHKTSIKDTNLSVFLGASKENKKPLLLVFGGGSGSLIINTWVDQNLIALVKRFRIIHLTGDKNRASSIEGDYYSVGALIDDMVSVLQMADVVMCRAGLGSITELSYLQKPAFLVPIKDSHQEYNAQAVSDWFLTLYEDSTHTWLDTLFTCYPQSFHTIQYPSRAHTIQSLNDYYTLLNKHLNSKKLSL